MDGTCAPTCAVDGAACRVESPSDDVVRIGAGCAGILVLSDVVLADADCLGVTVRSGAYTALEPALEVVAPGFAGRASGVRSLGDTSIAAFGLASAPGVRPRALAPRADVRRAGPWVLAPAADRIVPLSDLALGGELTRFTARVSGGGPWSGPVFAGGPGGPLVGFVTTSLGREVGGVVLDPETPEVRALLESTYCHARGETESGDGRHVGLYTWRHTLPTGEIGRITHSARSWKGCVVGEDRDVEEAASFARFEGWLVHPQLAGTATVPADGIRPLFFRRHPDGRGVTSSQLPPQWPAVEAVPVGGVYRAPGPGRVPLDIYTKGENFHFVWTTTDTTAPPREGFRRLSTLGYALDPRSTP